MYAYVAALVLGLSAGFLGAWNVQEWRHDSQDLKRQEIARENQRLAARAADAASERHEADKAALVAEFKPIYVEVERVVQKPIYRDGVCFDSDGLRLLERATRGEPATGQPAPAVPRSGAAR